MPEPILDDASEAATGTISSNTASLLSFTSKKRTVIINNRSGQTAYFKFNDAASPTVSNTAYDVALSDGGAMTMDTVNVANVSVYVAATSGIRVVGWK